MGKLYFFVYKICGKQIFLVILQRFFVFIFLLCHRIYTLLVAAIHFALQITKNISTYTQVMPYDGGSDIGYKESAYGDPSKEPYPVPPLKGGCFY